MEAWRSVEKDPPEMEQTIYATDGKGMWVGQIIRGYEEPLLDGLCLENGHAVCIPLHTFTEWKPAQAAFQKRKSAEEMFSDLGYVVTRMSAGVTVCDNKKGTSIVINANETGICAAKTIDSYIAGTAACWPGKTLVGAVPATVTVPLNKAERMALARLIEEMEDK